MNRLADRFINRILAYSINHPLVIITGTLAIAFAALLQTPEISFETDIKSLIPTDEVSMTDKEMRQTFGLRDSIVIGINNEPGVLNQDTLGYLQNICSQMEAIEGVYKVRSLFSEDNICGVNETVHIGPFIKTVTEKSVQHLRKSIEGSPAIQGILVSKNFKCTTVLVELEEAAHKHRVYASIKELLDRSPGPSQEEHYVAGMPVLESVLGDLILEDLVLNIPVVLVVIVVVLFLAYRSVPFVAITLMEILVVETVTLGLMGFLGIPIYVIQGIMPVILVALAVADEIHIFGSYSHFLRCTNAHPKLAATEAIMQLWRPVILTSVTTACAFLSFLSNPTKPLQYFGAMTAFGVMVAMLFSLFVTPSLLVILDRQKRSGLHSEIGLATRFSRFGSFLYRKRRFVRVSIVLAITIACVCISNLFVQDSWINNFDESSDVSRADMFLNENFLGTMTLQIEIDTGREDGLKNPEFLNSILEFQGKIYEFDGIGGSLSLAQIICKMSLEFTNNYSIPSSSRAISQYLFLLEGSTFEQFWDLDYRKTRIVVFADKQDYITGSHTLPRIRSHLKKHLPAVGTRLGGDSMISYHWVDLACTNQKKNTILSFMLILGVSSVFLRSCWKGFAVLAPVTSAVVIQHGVMGLFGIPIGVATSAFSSIVLGVGIDYAIHLQSEFARSRIDSSSEQATATMFASAGKAVFWDGVIIAAGFLVLLFSKMPPIRMLGFMVALGVASSIVSSLLILPVLLPVRKG